MHQYLESMKVNTPPAIIYEILRKIRGKPPRKINMLNRNRNIISAKVDIVNCLAEALDEVSDSSKCAGEFKIIKEREEKKCINFEGNNTEPYNELFTRKELTAAIRNTKDTTPGPDKIHYSMFRHLPEIAKQHVLHVFNQLWISSYFPDRWKDLITISIAKPNKDHSNPNNYSPISLTSCFCKIFEKIINGRLIEFLENNTLLASVQCGFRANHSTIGHLIRQDSYIRKAMAEGKLTIGFSSTLKKPMTSHEDTVYCGTCTN